MNEDSERLTTIKDLSRQAYEIAEIAQIMEEKVLGVLSYLSGEMGGSAINSVCSEHTNKGAIKGIFDVNSDTIAQLDAINRNIERIEMITNSELHESVGCSVVNVSSTYQGGGALKPQRP
ncbi:MAG: hypothetical protein RR390_00440 [Hafnia sp.]